MTVPPTKLLYHADTYLLTHTGAKVTSCETQAAVTLLVLDCSIFHPQSGGQPADKGTVKCAGGELVVGDAKLDKETGAVVLSCEGDAAPFVVGAEVEQCVDAAVRIRNARLHSAGHLLDVAVEAVCGKAWQPGKGYHFEDGPYVEYALAGDAVTPNMQDDAAKAALCAEIEAATNKLVAAGGSVDVKMDADGMRTVTMGGLGCPCGGTHIKDVKEIGAVKVTQLQKKKKNMRVSYTVEA
eukprot:1811811-Rhodomonas_salina.2